VCAVLRSGFFLAVVHLVDLRPLRPRIVFLTLLWRAREDFHLRDALAAVPERGAHAVGAGITTTDDHHVFAFGADEAAVAVIVEESLGVGVEEFHGEMDSLELAAFDR